MKMYLLSEKETKGGIIFKGIGVFHD